MGTCGRRVTSVRTKNRNQLDVYSVPIKIGGISVCSRTPRLCCTRGHRIDDAECMHASHINTHISAVILRTQRNIVRFHRFANVVRVHEINIVWRMGNGYAPRARSRTHTVSGNKFQFRMRAIWSTQEAFGQKKLFHRYATAACELCLRADTGHVAYFSVDRPIKILPAGIFYSMLRARDCRLLTVEVDGPAMNQRHIFRFQLITKIGILPNTNFEEKQSMFAIRLVRCDIGDNNGEAENSRKQKWHWQCVMRLRHDRTARRTNE